MFGEKGENFPMPKTAQVINFAWSGEWRAINNQANSPWKLGRTMRAIKEATGIFPWIVWNIADYEKKPLTYTTSPETALPFTAIIFSNGLGYEEYFTARPTQPTADIRKNPLARIRAKYSNFAARYGEYLYDLDSHWTPKDELKVDAPDHVYWKGNSFEKKTKTGREIYINLINFDRTYLTAKLWDNSRTVPPEVDGIKATVKLRPGEKVSFAYAISPDTPDMAPVKLEFSEQDGCVKIISSKLKYWNLLVVKISDPAKAEDIK